MFDPKSIMEKRELQEPIPTSDPADFPRSEEVPEGCIVLEDLKDEWGCQVDFHTDVVYAQREPEDWYVDPVGCTLKMHILEPIVHAGVPEEEKKKERKWPCIVYIQGSAFHKQWLWDHISRHIRMAEHGYVVDSEIARSFGDGSFSRSDAGRQDGCAVFKETL